MTLSQLLAFAAIAKHRNVSHASAELHASQSSITQKMKHLEGEFKIKLYQKSQRGIVLTEDGETFLGHAKAILKEVQKLTEHSPAPQSSKEPKALRVGGSFAPSASFLPLIMAEVRKRHPRTRLALKTHDSVTLERMLLKGELDVALLNHCPKSTHLVAEPFRREKLVVFASSNHPIAKKGRLTLCELARAPLVIRESKGSQTLIERLLREADSGIWPNIVLRCESPAAVKTAVRNNMGIGILFLSSVRPDIQNRRFKRLKLLDANLDIQTYVVYPRDSLSALTRNFIAYSAQFGHPFQPKPAAHSAESGRRRSE
jgi:DNA-binding transcriptional LysR family regulator